MSYRIDICHPNEIIKNAWVHADHADTLASAVDALASPIFTIYDGLCVRIVNKSNFALVYHGIYNAHECVNVGEGGKIQQFYESNILEHWAYSSSASVLLDKYHGLMDKRKIISFLSKRIRESLTWLLDPARPAITFKSIFDYIDRIDEWLEGKIDNDVLMEELEEVRFDYDQFPEFEASNILFAIILTMSIALENLNTGYRGVDETNIYFEVMHQIALSRVANGVTTAKADAMLAKQMRDVFPFMEIALKVVR